MGIPATASALLFGHVPEGAYVIPASLSFSKAVYTRLARTPSSDGNAQTWTLSTWIKRADVASSTILFSAGTSNTFHFDIALYSDGRILVDSDAASRDTFRCATTTVLKDTASFYHLVFVFDSTEPIQEDRFKIYINGEREILTYSTNVRSNAETVCNRAYPHYIGGQRNSDNSLNFHGSVADLHFIDGEALLPTDFGETDDFGVWQAVRFGGAHGQNGYHLKFADNSSVEALGYDSVLGNHWTVSNLLNVAKPYSTRVGATAIGSSTSFNKPISYLFDGDENTYLEAVGADLSSMDTIIQIDFPADLQPSFTSKLSINVNRFSDGILRVGYNGNALQTVPSGSGFYTHTLATGSGTLSQIVVSLQRPNNSSISSPGIRRISLDNIDLLNQPFSNYRIDSPTNDYRERDDVGAASQVPSNYATLNPIGSGFRSQKVYLQNGNLSVSLGNSKYVTYAFVSTLAVTSGKYYFEAAALDNFSGNHSIGILEASRFVNGVDGNPQYSAANFGRFTDGWSYNSLDGDVYNNNNIISSVSSWRSNEVSCTIGCAFDADNHILRFYKNGVLQVTIPNIPLGTYCFAIGIANPSTKSARGFNFGVNFGQQPFLQAPPSNHLALCTANLPEPPIKNGEDHFHAKTYIGNGASQTISDMNSMGPDMVWIKSRSDGDHHILMDTVRGDTSLIRPNKAQKQEITDGTSEYITDFSNDGFTIFDQPRSPGDSCNQLDSSLVAWAWNSGSSTEDNLDGTLTSQVRASPVAGFSIVRYEGTGRPETVGHGLNTPPALYIIKRLTGNTGTRSQHFDWTTYTTAIDGGLDYLKLNRNYVSQASTLSVPTSSVFSISASDSLNKLGFFYISYCFSSVYMYSAVGTYTGFGPNPTTGDSNSTGPFVFLNFKPAFLLIKKVDVKTADWVIFDSARNSSNPVSSSIVVNSESGEKAGISTSFYSNGFQVHSEDINSKNHRYLYYAVAENPFSSNGGLAR